MEENYTPVPWRVCTCKVGEEPHYASDALGKIVFRSSGTVELDAKVFAAAPDLLAALEQAVGMHGDTYPWGAQAMAAIAKAKGQHDD